MKKITLAIDLNGTLLDEEGKKLNSAFVWFFTKYDIDTMNIVFITGGTKRVANYAVTLLNKMFKDSNYCGTNKGKVLKPYIATNCGAKIYNPNGQIIKDVNIPAEKITTIVETARKSDPACAVLFNVGDRYIVDDQEALRTLSKIRYWRNVKIFAKKQEEQQELGDAGIHLEQTKLRVMTMDDVNNFLERYGNVQGITVMATTILSNSKLIFRAMKSAFANNSKRDLHMFRDGRKLEISPSDKKMAMQCIIDAEKDNPDFAKSLEQVICIGNNTNDVNLFKSTHYGVAFQSASDALNDVAGYKCSNRQGKTVLRNVCRDYTREFIVEPELKKK